jgi:hypothetical protein
MAAGSHARSSDSLKNSFKTLFSTYLLWPIAKFYKTLFSQCLNVVTGLTECTNNSIQMRLSFCIASARRDVLFFLIIIISLVIILQWLAKGSAKVSVYYCMKFKVFFFGFSKAEHFYFLSTSDLILWPYLPYHLVRVLYKCCL